MPGDRAPATGGEVVVVLGAAVWAGGAPSPALQRRVMHGVEQWKRRGARSLLMTGGLGRFPPSEASVMAALARRLGVPAGALLLESRATTTRESARHCSPIIAEHGFERVIVVTDRYHLRRSELAFRQQGLRVEGAAPPDPVPGPSRSRRLRRAAREWIGLAWYRLGR